MILGHELVHAERGDARRTAQPGRRSAGVPARSERRPGELLDAMPTRHDQLIVNLLALSNWSRVWRAAVGRADIGQVRIHDLRYTYASWLRHGGVPIARVSAVGTRLDGHHGEVRAPG